MNQKCDLNFQEHYEFLKNAIYFFIQKQKCQIVNKKGFFIF